MQRIFLSMLAAWSLLFTSANAQEDPLADLQFGPIESFAIALHYAKAGNWDQHFTYSVHPDDLAELKPLLAGDGKAEFIEMFKTRKMPRIVETYEQVKDTSPIIFRYQGSTVALLKLKRPIRSTQAILMYKQGDHYVVKNSCPQNPEMLKKLEAAIKAD